MIQGGHTLYGFEAAKSRHQKRHSQGRLSYVAAHGAIYRVRATLTPSWNSCILFVHYPWEDLSVQTTALLESGLVTISHPFSDPGTDVSSSESYIYSTSDNRLFFVRASWAKPKPKSMLGPNHKIWLKAPNHENAAHDPNSSTSLFTRRYDGQSGYPAERLSR